MRFLLALLFLFANQTVQMNMGAAVPEFALVPAALPAKTVLSSWETHQLVPRACGKSLDIVYAADGGRIEWSSSRDCGGNDASDRGHSSPGCYDDGYPGYDNMMTANQSARINGRRVFFSVGNHGSNAWACIPVTINGRKDMAVAGLWESNFMSPIDAMRLVAFARPAKA